MLYCFESIACDLKVISIYKMNVTGTLEVVVLWEMGMEMEMGENCRSKSLKFDTMCQHQLKMLLLLQLREELLQTGLREYHSDKIRTDRDIFYTYSS